MHSKVDSFLMKTVHKTARQGYGMQLAAIPVNKLVSPVSFKLLCLQLLPSAPAPAPFGRLNILVVTLKCSS